MSFKPMKSIRSVFSIALFFVLAIAVAFLSLNLVIAIFNKISIS